MSKRSSNSGSRGFQSRVSSCGSKGGASAYDPQVAAASASEAKTAQEAEQFSQNYYTNTVAPLVTAETAQAQQTTADQNALFNINLPEAKQAAAQYDQYGIPAQDNYYKMVSNYSAPQEQQSEATAALGDMRSSEAANRATLERQQASYGINPTSGAAVSAASDAATQNTAAEAGAETRARYNAKMMGMQLTSDAASYSNTGVSNLASTSGTASGAATGALGAAATATGSANQSASVPMAGYSLANDAYGNNLNAYSKMASADIATQAQGDAGLGSALGALGALALKIPSDRRLKTNIVQIGTWRHNLPAYEYEYKGDPTRFRGVMADDVEKVMPAAVKVHSSGYKMVDYEMLRAA